MGFAVGSPVEFRRVTEKERSSGVSSSTPSYRPRMRSSSMDPYTSGHPAVGRDTDGEEGTRGRR